MAEENRQKLEMEPEFKLAEIPDLRCAILSNAYNDTNNHYFKLTREAQVPYDCIFPMLDAAKVVEQRINDEEYDAS